jgi:hypothetical protein
LERVRMARASGDSPVRLAVLCCAMSTKVYCFPCALSCSAYLLRKRGRVRVRVRVRPAQETG